MSWKRVAIDWDNMSPNQIVELALLEAELNKNTVESTRSISKYPLHIQKEIKCLRNGVQHYKYYLK